jgi:tetratricopeptide (TPR) repeat protein
MRNQRAAITGVLFSTLVIATAGGGCTSATDKPAGSSGKNAMPTQGASGTTPVTGALRRADTALAARDYAGTIAAAEEQLAAVGNTPRSRAQALYYKGRAVEGRPKASPAESTADLAQARSLYEQALAAGAVESDEAVIRASLANVAYFQDDFTTARGNWMAAQKLLPDQDSRGWALYRIGLCEQRLGRFAEADRTFEQVQRNYPGTEQARRAKEHQGATSFRVQIATFTKPETADRLVAELKGKGLTGVKQTDTQGRTVVLLTGYATYPAAKAAREQVAGDYPDAIVLP